MFFANYPALCAEFEQALLIADSLRATLKIYQGRPRNPNVDLWTASMSRYVQAMFHLTLLLIPHPEWAGPLNRLFTEPGCPAQRIPQVEEFLLKEGIVLPRGNALIINEPAGTSSSQKEGRDE